MPFSLARRIYRSHDRDGHDARTRRACLFTPCAIALLALTSSVSHAAEPARPLCAYISSYHQGYSWSDRLEEGLLPTLRTRCDIVRYDMDTKRKRDESDKQYAADVALSLIQSHRPHIVITSDDNAAKYLIVPFLADTSLPVVFTGINWTVDEYGFPTDNVTGMVEVAPLQPMLAQALEVVPDARRATYIGADTLTERKNFDRLAKAASTSGVTLSGLFADTMERYESAFEQAHRADFVIVGSHSGIDNWDRDRAVAMAQRHSAALSVTNHDWMMPVAMLGYTKLPEEQGEWAAQAAIAILDGIAPRAIPIVTNRKWDTWLNDDLRRRAGIELPAQLLDKAKRIQP